ncbi:MAG TPA: DNA gyrase inhibitor YacG [Phycisphaerales bacterium]|nr:DNA gyrase inhibitor YacG [Phycisphaerales bacterium]
MSQKCPKCNKQFPCPSKGQSRSEHFPFCSERCKLIDLGAWIDGQYRIPDQNSNTEQDQQNLPDDQ